MNIMNEADTGQEQHDIAIAGGFGVFVEIKGSGCYFKRILQRFVCS